MLEQDGVRWGVSWASRMESQRKNFSVKTSPSLLGTAFRRQLIEKSTFIPLAVFPQIPLHKLFTFPGCARLCSKWVLDPKGFQML